MDEHPRRIDRPRKLDRAFDGLGKAERPIIGLVADQQYERSLAARQRQPAGLPDEQLAGALDYAHRKGISHRDVKPGNIFVDPNDHVTLVDFGIARAAGE